MSEQLCYVQLQSCVNPSFWSKLAEVKLDVDKLSEATRHIWGYFQIINNTNLPLPMLEVDSTSFNNNFNAQNIYIPFEGKLKNVNTIEQFKECDKMQLIKTDGLHLLGDIKSGKVLENPALLNRFLVLSFADLKTYLFYYWFAFPVPKGITIETLKKLECTNLHESTVDLYSTIWESYQKLEPNQKPYFLVEKTNPFTIYHLTKIKHVTLENVSNFYFAFHNISSDTSGIGSQLRNYAALILYYCPFLENKTQEFLAFALNREGTNITCNQSSILTLKLLKTEQDLETWVGWEKNEKGKMCPRVVNMKNTLDPTVLAENAVDLNLKLMKWRVMPNIDLEKIKTTKCLLLGSGTLGCSVARTLLAWGIRSITFVDNSTVSFSNPVRQSLFSYQDSVDSKPKATAAADNLKSIFPGVNSVGVELNIPMPGHSVGDSMLEQTKENVKTLVRLITEHDVIFLLMDSRESRWLPTMLGAFYNKIVINSALGFDTYLVMRHGSKSQENDIAGVCSDDTIKGSNLGCYFCNDVTAPGNSIKDRTLDQQCTVTRPGVSSIAGALAVELAISLLQHKDGSNAPAYYKVKEDFGDDENQSVLGLLPHSIRGFLSNFTQILPATFKFANCIACSDKVLKQYENDGFDFLLKVFNSSKYLEDVASLTQMFQEVNFDDVLEWSDNEEEDD